MHVIIIIKNKNRRMNKYNNRVFNRIEKILYYGNMVYHGNI